MRKPLRERSESGNPHLLEMVGRQADDRTIAVWPVIGYMSAERAGGSEMPEGWLDTHVFHQILLAIQEVLSQLGERENLMRRRVDPRGGNVAERLSVAFEREAAAFEEELPSLLQSRRGWFVAFRNGKLIDMDKDEFALAARIERQFGSEFVLLRGVSDKSESVVLDSPEGEIP